MIYPITGLEEIQVYLRGNYLGENLARTLELTPLYFGNDSYYF